MKFKVLLIYMILLIKNIFNNNEKEYERMNPINFISAKEPPFLFMHGDYDIYVSLHKLYYYIIN